MLTCTHNIIKYVKEIMQILELRPVWTIASTYVRKSGITLLCNRKVLKVFQDT